jgi:hypothetical protein
MKRVSSIIIPVPVAICFLCAFAYAGNYLGQRAASFGIHAQIMALTR